MYYVNHLLRYAFFHYFPDQAISAFVFDVSFIIFLVIPIARPKKISFYKIGILIEFYRKYFIVKIGSCLSLPRTRDGSELSKALSSSVLGYNIVILSVGKI